MSQDSTADNNASTLDHWQEAEEGSELFEEGEIEQALSFLNNLIEQNPKNEYAFFYLGKVWFEKEQWEKALKCFVKAIDLAPKYLGSMIACANTLRMIQKYPQAIVMAKQAYLIAPEDPDVLYQMGLIYFEAQDWSQARKYLQDFLQFNKDIELAIEVKGVIQTIEAQHPELLQNLEDADF